MLKEEKIDKVFVSGHIPEMRAGFEEELMNICEKASELGLKIILDISKPMYEKIKLPKIYALRLDYGFNLEEIVKLYHEKKFVIELNASTISEEAINYLISRGVNLQEIRISHNFYPKKYTGLSRKTVIEKNKYFRSLGMNVAIYIPSSNQKRPPMYEGLPTIEEHRNQDLEAVLSEARTLLVNDLIFGDSYCSKEELIKARDFDFNTYVIPVKLYKELPTSQMELLERVHFNRTDANPYFVRSSCRSKENILKDNTIERKKGMVTIDNEMFKRYQGEVCVMLEDLEADERVNVVGEALCSEEYLKMIKGGNKFKLKIIK